MSAKPLQGRVTAGTSGKGVVVFLIGMRVNHLWAVRHWLPVFAAMPRMLKELSRDPEAGLLGYELLLGSPRAPYVVQYWESREKLLAYAAAPDKAHRPEWAKFNRRLRDGAPHVGLWHETFDVPAGHHESVYADMPPQGLGRAFGAVPLGGGVRAKDRFAA